MEWRKFLCLEVNERLCNFLDCVSISEVHHCGFTGQDAIKMQEEEKKKVVAFSSVLCSQKWIPRAAAAAAAAL
jgi:hypothetical protein